MKAKPNQIRRRERSNVTVHSKANSPAASTAPGTGAAPVAQSGGAVEEIEKQFDKAFAPLLEIESRLQEASALFYFLEEHFERGNDNDNVLTKEKHGQVSAGIASLTRRVVAEGGANLTAAVREFSELRDGVRGYVQHLNRERKS